LEITTLDSLFSGYEHTLFLELGLQYGLLTLCECSLVLWTFKMKLCVYILVGVECDGWDGMGWNGMEWDGMG